MKEHTIIYGEEGHTILLEGPLLIGKDDSAVDTIIRCVKEVGDCAKNAKSAKTQSPQRRKVLQCSHHINPTYSAPKLTRIANPLQHESPFIFFRTAVIEIRCSMIVLLFNPISDAQSLGTRACSKCAGTAVAVTKTAVWE